MNKVSAFIFSGIIYLFLFSSNTHAQEFRHYYQIYTDDTIQKIQCIEYDNDTTGAILEYKLSEDNTDIYLLNYNGTGRIKLSYQLVSGEVREMMRYKCNIHSLPHL